MVIIVGRRDTAPLQDRYPVAAAHVVCNLRRKALVVHEQEVDLPDVANQEFFEAVGEKMASLTNEYRGSDSYAYTS